MSPVVATILMVAITIVLAATLYLLVVNLARGPGTSPQIIGLDVNSNEANWTVRFVSVPPGKLPNSTYVLIRDGNFNILLPRTPISALTNANWGVYRITLQDISPGVEELTPGDRLLVDRTFYPRPCVLEISDEMQILAIRTLD